MNSILALEKRAGSTGETLSKVDEDISIIGEKVSNLGGKKISKKIEVKSEHISVED